MNVLIGELQSTALKLKEIYVNTNINNNPYTTKEDSTIYLEY